MKRCKFVLKDKIKLFIMISHSVASHEIVLAKTWDLLIVITSLIKHPSAISTIQFLSLSTLKFAGTTFLGLFERLKKLS